MYLHILTKFVDPFEFSYVGYYQFATIPTIHNCLRQKSVHLRVHKIFLALIQLLLQQYVSFKTASGPKFDYS